MLEILAWELRKKGRQLPSGEVLAGRLGRVRAPVQDAVGDDVQSSRTGLGQAGDEAVKAAGFFCRHVPCAVILCLT